MKSHKLMPFLFIFDLSMFHNVIRIKKEGLISPHIYGFIFDVPDGLPLPQKSDIFGSTSQRVSVVSHPASQQRVERFPRGSGARRAREGGF
jgi:hypothetical protein